MSTKCITFYSYKGGSGRSTTAINTIRALAEQLRASAEKPILLIDSDLESAGLTYFFNMQNKFCNDYTHYGTFHTTHILNIDGATVFPFDRVIPERLIPAPNNFLELFSDKDCFGEQRLRNDEIITAEELFSGVLLALNEWKILSSIMEQYIGFKRRKENNLRYDPRELVDELKDIHIDPNGSSDQKVIRIRDFIPARTFPDISEYFGCTPGTIRFLGVDVMYDGAQIAKNTTAESQIINLQKECTNKKFAAIIFDSGAGTQSTAHAFHAISDVIVYCMRPSLQFIEGTNNNLYLYQSVLNDSREELKNKEDSKNVIILPTAVPRSDNNGEQQLNQLSAESFKKIARIAKDHKNLVDDYFCKPENTLCEVKLFKFREHILGVKLSDNYDVTDDVKHILNIYSDPNSPDFPADAKEAYQTYNMLAKKIIENCEV